LTVLSQVPLHIPWQLWFVIIAGGIGMVIIEVLRQLGRNRRGARASRPAAFAEGTFERCSLLSPAELEFFFALEQAVGNQFRIAMKVRLGDLLNVRGNDSAAWTARNKTHQKHVDFVLCTVQEVEPVLVIELDDSSHHRAERMERDGFVDQCLGTVGIRVLHVPCGRGYDVRQLASEIRRHFT
jgi:hypothetical protein